MSCNTATIQLPTKYSRMVCINLRMFGDTEMTMTLQQLTQIQCGASFFLPLSITGFFDQKTAANMMKESEKMQGFEHPHILNIIGVCVDAGPAPYIVMPFMANGSLLAYIKRERMNLVVPNDAADNELASLY